MLSLVIVTLIGIQGNHQILFFNLIDGMKVYYSLDKEMIKEICNENISDMICILGKDVNPRK